MPRPSHRSRKGLKRTKKRLPGGRLTTHYTRKKAKRAACSSCGTPLQGVSLSTTKTQKRPQRPYGGVLCFNCLQQMMIEKARKTA